MLCRHPMDENIKYTLYFHMCRLCIIVSLRRQLSGGGAVQVIELVVRVSHRHEESV